MVSSPPSSPTLLHGPVGTPKLITVESYTCLMNKPQKTSAGRLLFALYVYGIYVLYEVVEGGPWVVVPLWLDTSGWRPLLVPRLFV